MSEGKEEINAMFARAEYGKKLFKAPEPMTNILALIRNPDLSTDEAIVGSSICSVRIAEMMMFDFQCTGKKNIEHFLIPQPFSTSKDLKLLEKQFREAKITAVYLREKEMVRPQIIQRKAQRSWACVSCNSTIRKGEINYMSSTDTWSHYCERCRGEIKTEKRITPIMLAVFAPSAVVDELLGTTTASPTDDSVEEEDIVRGLV